MQVTTVRRCTRNAVQGLLSKFDISIDELICGAHWSMHQETMVSQVRTMDEPHKVHNNCSGKHAGMLILSKLMSGKTFGYANLTNAAQQQILGTLEFMTGLDLDAVSSWYRWLRRACVLCATG